MCFDCKKATRDRAVPPPVFILAWQLKGLWPNYELEIKTSLASSVDWLQWANVARGHQQIFRAGGGGEMTEWF